MFHPHWRESALASLDGHFDVVVIGGGINGAGIAMDASVRGLRTLLVERDDIASGTSSRSSKLIHGGLRYLKHMQFRVTRLSCRERDRMIELNPNLVRPVRFLYPAYRGDKLPGWSVDLGLWMYDRLTQRPDKHTQVPLAELEELLPGIDSADLDRVLAYWDAMTDDARLTLSVAATALSFGARILTRASVEEGIRNSAGKIVGLTLRDLESGSTHEVRGHVIVNATGHWTDHLRARFDLPGQRVRPSRGSHLIFSSDRLPIQAALGFPSPDDGRPLFAIPHPEGVLAGTTDIYHDDNLDDPRPTRHEAGYILRAVQARFPTHHLSPDDVVSSYAGLRPILDTHAEDPSEASREEGIWNEQGLLSVAGGKLTTWRVTAEEAVDAVVDLLPDERALRAGGCLTKGTPLVGLAPRNLEQDLIRAHALDTKVAHAMARRLGSAAWLACSVSESASDLQPLEAGCDLSTAEIRAHVRFGGVRKLEDLLVRRVRTALWDPSLAGILAPRAAEILAGELGWDSARREAELGGLDAALLSWAPLRFDADDGKRSPGATGDT